MLETLSGLKNQVRLSHSGYYQAQTFIDGVARTIVASDDEAVAVLAEFVAASSTYDDSEARNPSPDAVKQT